MEIDNQNRKKHLFLEIHRYIRYIEGSSFLFEISGGDLRV